MVKIITSETSVCTRSFLLEVSRNKELDLGWWPKVAPRWDVVHGMAKLGQVLRRSTSQAVACNGIQLEIDTGIGIWKPMEVPSYCRRDRIVFADFEDQTCGRVKDRLETVKKVRAYPIEEAIVDTRCVVKTIAWTSFLLPASYYKYQQWFHITGGMVPKIKLQDGGRPSSWIFFKCWWLR